MKIEIKSRYSDEVLWSGEAESISEAVVRAIKGGTDLSAANLRSANLRSADLRGADLGGANLSAANLSAANLSGVNISWANLSAANLSAANIRAANLSGANISWANLSGVNISGANISGANLSSANLRDCQGIDAIPAIPDLDGKILAAIKAGGELDMSRWHTCQTTHCRAGWSIMLAGEAGRVLEWAMGANTAGALIYARSYPELPVPDFYASNEEAMKDMQKRAALAEVKA